MSKKKVQILLEVTINDSLIEASDWQVERAINSALHIGVQEELNDSDNQDVCDNIIDFRTKVVSI